MVNKAHKLNYTQKKFESEDEEASFYSLIQFNNEAKQLKHYLVSRIKVGLVIFLTYKKMMEEHLKKFKECCIH